MQAHARALAPATVKQHLAAIRMLFDWLVLGHAVRTNPAAAVRGPKHVVRTGKTPALSAEEARALLDAIDTYSVVGLRDRALIGVMVYGFARISAILVKEGVLVVGYGTFCRHLRNLPAPVSDADAEAA